MSTIEREARMKVLLDEIMALSRIEPKGIAVHSAVTVPYPVPVGAKLCFGALQASHMDALLNVETTRRIGMGTYRIFFGMFPEPPAALLVAS